MPGYSPSAFKAWTRFREELAAACLDVGCNAAQGEEPWFRGESRSTYELLPSLLRPTRKQNLASKKGAITKRQRKQIWEMESDLFWEFAARARELFGVIENDWDILFAMQHYGTPTRLLDWTEVLGVALYFAIGGAARAKDATPCIWVLNPYELNRQSAWKCSDLLAPDNLGWDEGEGEMYSYSELLLESGIDWDDPVAIYPRQRNARIHAQRGWFTIHGDRFEALDARKSSKRYLRKVSISPGAVDYGLQFLEDAGFDHYALFPDLASLSQHLKQKYKLV